MSQENIMMDKPKARKKIIKRYQNRKLYDTQQSCYVTLDDISKMIRADEEVMVIDNKTKNDITSATLTQIIFEAEKRAARYAPLYTLREIIQNANGSISSYLAKLGAFPMDYYQTQQAAQAEIIQNTQAGPSYDDVKQTLEERVANAANAAASETDGTATEIPSGTTSGDAEFTLPNSNQSFEN